MTQCTCQQLGGTIYGSELPTTHRIGCELREHELRDLLIELTTGIADWANQEDGVPDRLWPYYRQACLLAGMPVTESTP